MHTEASLYGSGAERAFSILAWTLTLPWMLAGFCFFGVMGVIQLIALEKIALPMLALVLAGLIGLMGLLGSYFASSRTNSSRIEGQITCLIVGVVSALVLSGVLAASFLVSLSIFDTSDLFFWWVPVGFTLLAVEGLLAIKRLRKARLEAEGVPDTVPSVDSLMLATAVLIALTVLVCSGI